MAGDLFRSVMGTVCTHVTVVTTAAVSGRPHGTTVSAFASLSLDPPMVSVALDRGSRLLAEVRRSRRVGINLLTEGQDELAMRFAGKSDTKFDGVEWHDHHGLPRLGAPAGWLACDVHDLVEGGDHVLLLCLVEDVDVSDRRPLVYGHRRFGTHSKL